MIIRNGAGITITADEISLTMDHVRLILRISEFNLDIRDFRPHDLVESTSTIAMILPMSLLLESKERH